MRHNACRVAGGRQVHIEADFEEQIELAEKMVTPMLDPESEEFMRQRDAGQLQVAKARVMHTARLFRTGYPPDLEKTSRLTRFLKISSPRFL